MDELLATVGYKLAYAPGRNDPVAGDFVEVSWLDSGMHIELVGWQSTSDYLERAALDKMLVTTVGILVHIDADVVLVGLSRDAEHDAWMGMQLIARQNVRDMRVLS